MYPLGSLAQLLAKDSKEVFLLVDVQSCGVVDVTSRSGFLIYNFVRIFPVFVSHGLVEAGWM